MVVILTTWYHANSQRRFLENKQTILANALLDNVEKLIVFFETPLGKPINLQEQPQYAAVIKHPKIEIIYTDKRQSYQSLFDIGNRDDLHGNLIVIANTDILFNETIKHLEQIPTNSVAALTRYERSKDRKTLTLPTQYDGSKGSWSFDTYAYKSPLKSLKNIDILVGVNGCDNLLVKRLLYDNATIVSRGIVNPCGTVISQHIESDTEHNYEPFGINYHRQVDYPGPWNPNWKQQQHSVDQFGPLRGIAFQNIDGSLMENPSKPIANNGRRVIGISLWGSAARYCVGVIRCVEKALELYPDFECWIYYHVESVPPNVIQQLSLLPNVMLFAMSTPDVHRSNAMMWRIRPIDDPTVEILLSRDVDSRFYEREVAAVRQWIRSGKRFHIIRDHPYHETPIMVGMCGMRKNAGGIESWTNLIEEKMAVHNSNYMYDSNFMRDHVYPRIKADAMIHDSCQRFPGCVDEKDQLVDFPIPFNEHYDFIGGYVNEFEQTNPFHVNILIKHLNEMKNPTSKPNK